MASGNGNAAQIAKLRAALAEILSRRNVFSHETYTQIILALYDRIRVLQSDDEAKASEGSDEIRLVTVMFIDILDSTQIAHQVAAEDWKFIIGETYNRLGVIVREWGGEVAQYLGDGILCFFGAQRSVEDDAVRAVNCALAAQEAMLKYATELKQKYKFRFAVRIGMSTGRVVVGLIGDDDKRELLALGTPTNLAARLQVLAEPGRVLIDAQTYYRVRKYFTTQAHPLAQVKGFELPVEYYTVIGKRRSAQLTFDRIAGIEVDFVGRTREFHQIMSVLETARNDSVLWGVQVSGELGIGKSRLLQEILNVAEGYHQIVMIGEHERQQKAYSLLRSFLALRCDLKDDMPPEMVEQRIIQHICATWTHADAEVAAHVIGFLTGYGFTTSPHVRTLQAGKPDARQIGYTWVARWFHGLTLDAQAPLLIAVDNVQWIDQESLGLLEFLGQELARLPVVILAATRSGTTLFSDLSRVLHIPLSPISQADIAVMTESVLRHVADVPPAMRQLIADRAEGNPLFVEEFLLMLFDTGVFEQTGEMRWRANRYQFAALALDMPNNLLGLLQARLDDLPPVTRRALQAASVMGQTFWQGALAALQGVESATLSPLLTDLEMRGIIVRQPQTSFKDEREYTFRHTLYPEVAYLMLTRPVREAYHRDVAAWLAARIANHPDYLGMLADHYHKGQQPQEALTTYLTGARDCYRRGLLRETLDMIERGQAAANEKVPREIALPMVSQLWMLQGQTLEALDRYEESSAASQSALMLMDELPPTDMVEERVIAARTLGSAQMHLARYDEAFRALNHAHSLLPKENTRQHAAILRAFGLLCYTQGQLNESWTFGEQALKLAQGGDPREYASVIALLGMVALDRGFFAPALEYAEQVLAINRQQGNLYYQILDLRQIASLYRCLFDYERSLALCAEADALQTRIRYQDPLLKTNRALNLIALGQPGLHLLREAAGGTYQNVQTGWRVQLALVNGLGLVGEYELCRAGAAALAEITRGQNNVIYGRALLWLGTALRHLNETETAWTTLLSALENELAFGGRDLWLCYHALGQFDAQPEAADYRQKAVDMLRDIATSFQSRADLYSTFVNSPIVRVATGA